LATRRDQVDFINEKKLAELPGEEYVSVGKIEGDFPESSLPTQLNLSIKEQAQVINISILIDTRYHTDRPVHPTTLIIIIDKNNLRLFLDG